MTCEPNLHIHPTLKTTSTEQLLVDVGDDAPWTCCEVNRVNALRDGPFFPLDDILDIKAT